MTLNIEEETEVTFGFDYGKIANDVCSAVLDNQDFPYEVEISITLTDEESIKEINSEFRSIDSATDVLSFPLIEYPAAGDFSLIDDNSDIFNPDTGEAMLGDIVISVPRVFAQAEEYGHSEFREYAFLITHSMLHLLGYDHMEEDDRILMEDRQKEILDKLKITRAQEGI